MKRGGGGKKNSPVDECKGRIVAKRAGEEDA